MPVIAGTVTVVVARIVLVPGVGDVIVTLHEPVPGAVVPEPEPVVHVLGPTKLPTEPDSSEKVMLVPSGAFAGPVPSSTFTCPVKMCLALTGFVFVSGLI